MKKGIVVLIVLLAAGYAAYTQWPRNTTDGARVLYGNVDIREVRLGFRVAGRLDQMNFEEGDAVSAGTVLAALDSKPLRDGLALAEAGVAVGAGGRYADLRHQPRQLLGAGDGQARHQCPHAVGRRRPRVISRA